MLTPSCTTTSSSPATTTPRSPITPTSQGLTYITPTPGMPGTPTSVEKEDTSSCRIIEVEVPSLTSGTYVSDPSKYFERPRSKSDESQAEKSNKIRTRLPSDTRNAVTEIGNTSLNASPNASPQISPKAPESLEIRKKHQSLENFQTFQNKIDRTNPTHKKTKEHKKAETLSKKKGKKLARSQGGEEIEHSKPSKKHKKSKHRSNVELKTHSIGSYQSRRHPDTSNYIPPLNLGLFVKSIHMEPAYSERMILMRPCIEEKMGELLLWWNEKCIPKDEGKCSRLKRTDSNFVPHLNNSGKVVWKEAGRKKTVEALKTIFNLFLAAQGCRIDFISDQRKNPIYISTALINSDDAASGIKTRDLIKGIIKSHELILRNNRNLAESALKILLKMTFLDAYEEAIVMRDFIDHYELWLPSLLKGIKFHQKTESNRYQKELQHPPTEEALLKAYWDRFYLHQFVKGYSVKDQRNSLIKIRKEPNTIFVFDDKRICSLDDKIIEIFEKNKKFIFAYEEFEAIIKNYCYQGNLIPKKPSNNIKRSLIRLEGTLSNPESSFDQCVFMWLKSAHKQQSEAKQILASTINYLVDWAIIIAMQKLAIYKKNIVNITSEELRAIDQEKKIIFSLNEDFKKYFSTPCKNDKVASWELLPLILNEVGIKLNYALGLADKNHKTSAPETKS